MKLIFINKDNNALDLLNNQDKIVLVGAEALHGIDTDYAEVDSPYVDGTSIENVRALPRGIVLTFRLVGNVQRALDLFTGIVKSKQVGTLRETDNNGRVIEIQGRVKVPPYTRISEACIIQLELYCSQPYWEDLEAVIGSISEIIPLLYLPDSEHSGLEGRAFPEDGIPFGVVDTNKTKVFENDGDTSVGMTIEIIALDEVVNPKISCSSGSQNGWYMQLGSASKPFIMAAGDAVVITTTRGKKSIKYNGSATYKNEAILNYLSFYGYDWLQLETGSNEFVIDTDAVDANVFFNIAYKRRYE